MRIGITTPSYDSQEPHFHMQYNFADGSFVEVGERAVNRWDHRITSVIVSELPRCVVCTSGRSLSRGGRWPDFLSVRIGHTRPKYVALSIKSTTFLRIDSKGALTVRRRRIGRERFEAFWGKVMKGRLNSSACRLSRRILSIAEGTEPDTSPNGNPATINKQ